MKEIAQRVLELEQSPQDVNYLLRRVQTAEASGPETGCWMARYDEYETGSNSMRELVLGGYNPIRED